MSQNVNNNHDDWKSRLPNRKVERPAMNTADAAAEEKEPMRGDWLDILALIIATYQVLAFPLLLILGGLGLVTLLFFLVFR